MIILSDVYLLAIARSYSKAVVAVTMYKELCFFRPPLHLTPPTSAARVRRPGPRFETSPLPWLRSQQTNQQLAGIGANQRPLLTIAFSKQN